MLFESPGYVIHNVVFRPDDVMEISYTEKRDMLEWGYVSRFESFDAKEVIPEVEIEQLLESLDTIITLVSTKRRLEAK